MLEPWKRYGWHLPVAVLAALGGASGLEDASTTAGALFWWACVAGALLNAVLYGIGRERSRAQDPSA